MILARLSRLGALAIAIGGVTDPVWTRYRPVAPPVSIVVVDSPSLALPDPAGASRRSRAHRSAAVLRERLGDEYDVTVQTHARHAPAAACPGAGACVLVSDGAAPARLTAGASVVGALLIDESAAPNVAILGMTQPRDVHVHGAATLRVRLRGDRVRGTSQLRLLDGGVPVGESSYEWPAAAARDGIDVEVGLDWMPLAAGLRHVRVEVSPLEGESTTLDNAADAGVEVAADAIPVLMYEPEATWSGTFVRRAVTADPRLSVRARTRLAPDVAVTGASVGPLSRDELSAVQAVIVSAPDRLTTADTDLLDRFVRVRGGSLVLIVNGRPRGPAAALGVQVAREVREREPVPIGPLEAAEFVVFEAGTDGVLQLDAWNGQPVVSARRMGRGQVVSFGAIDAWRYRGEGRFERYWQRLVLEAAALARPPLELTLTPAVARPGEPIRVALEWQSMEPLPAAVSAAANLRCGERELSVRLRPAGRPGAWTGRLTPDATGACSLEASITSDRTLATSAELLITPAVEPPLPRMNAISGAVSAHGGLAGADIEALAERIRQQVASEPAVRETRPFRSPWWLVPFAGCLGLEWWLRRRAGVR